MNRLKELRKQKSLTLDEIAQETGVKRGTYNNYENGKTNPKPEIWGKLAKYFDVPISYLQGQGWSKEHALENLAIIYASYYGSDFFEDFDFIEDSDLFEDENCKDGRVFKYQKNMIEELDDHSYIILKTAYSLGITNDDNMDWSVINNEKLPYVDSFSSEDRETINQELLNNGENINVYQTLNQILSKDEIDELRFDFIDEFLIDENVLGDLSFEKSKFFSLFKKVANKYLKVLNDYAFLSTIEENQYKTGIAGGYELAQRIQEDMQNSLSQKTPKDKQELINRLAAIKDNDVKAGLLALYDSLSGKIDKLNDRVDVLEKRLSDSKVHNQPGRE